MRGLLIVFSLFLANNVLFSQNMFSKKQQEESFSMKWTGDIAEKSTYNDQIVKTYLMKNNEFYSVRIDEDFRHGELVYFDSSFRKKCTGDVDKDLKIDGEKYELSGSMVIDKVLHLVGATIKETSIEMAATPVSNCTIDKKGIALDPIEVEKQKGKFKFAAYDGQSFLDSKKSQMLSEHSSNGKYTLFYTRIGSIEKDFQNIVMIVLDDKFNKVSVQQTLVPVKYVDFGFESAVVSNEGVPSVVVKSVDYSGFFGNKVDIKYFVLTGNKENVSIDSLPQDLFTRSVKLDVDENNKVLLFSLRYPDNKWKSKLSKLNISEIGKDGKINKLNEIAIDEKFMADNKFDEKTGLTHLIIRFIDKKKEGSYFLSLEHFESIMVSSNNFDETKTGLSLKFDKAKRLENKIYENILVFEMSPSHSMNWVKNIEKKQYFASSNFVNYGGFKTMLDGNNLVLIYNDHRKNYDAEPDKSYISVQSLSDASLIYRVVSKDDIVSTALYDGTKEKTNLKVPSFSKVGENKMLFCGNNIVALGKTTKTSKYGLLTIRNNAITNNVSDSKALKDTSTKSNIKTLVASKDTAIKKMDSALKSTLALKDTSKNKLALVEKTKDSSKKDTTLKASAKIKDTKPKRTYKQIQDSLQKVVENLTPKMDTTPYVVPELKAPPVVLDKRSSNTSLEYFQKLRTKFEEDEIAEKARKEKEAKELAEKKRREFENRHLKPEDAPVFDKARYSEPPKDEPKKQGDDYYKEIFK